MANSICKIRSSASALLGALMLFGAAHASANEVFECREPVGEFNKDYPVIVVATKNDDGKTGVIEVVGVKYSTGYRVEGFSRYWLFGGNESNYQYILVIEASGDAKYSDYGPDGDSWLPDTQHFYCEPQKKKRR